MEQQSSHDYVGSNSSLKQAKHLLRSAFYIRLSKRLGLTISDADVQILVEKFSSDGRILHEIHNYIEREKDETHGDLIKIKGNHVEASSSIYTFLKRLLKKIT